MAAIKAARMSVVAIVPAHNEADALPATIGSLRAQTVQPDRILDVITDAQAARLWDRLRTTPTGCWEFNGKANIRGYGVVSIGRNPSRRTALTHRIAWTLENGPIPKGMFVCHACDNPPCCNPGHLFVGTNQDNVRDAVRKNRHSKPPTGSGERNNFAKLSAEDVAEIRRLFVREFEWRPNGAWRTNARELGLLYGVTGANIRMIMRGASWS